MDSQKPRQVLLRITLIMLVAILGLSLDQAIGTATAAGANDKTGGADVISLEIGKAKLVRLSVTPHLVMLGNPAVADVVVEDNGQLFLLGREPGETNMLIINRSGKVIMSSAVVVGPMNKRRVTIDNGPDTFTLSCNPRCVPVATPEGSGATTAATTAAAGAAAIPGNQAAIPAATQDGGSEAGAGDPANIANALSNLLGSLPSAQ